MVGLTSQDSQDFYSSSSSSEENLNAIETMVKDGKNRMFVIKRNGREEPVHFDKITSRIEKLCYRLDMDFIDPPAITLKVVMDAI